MRAHRPGAGTSDDSRGAHRRVGLPTTVDSQDNHQSDSMTIGSASSGSPRVEDTPHPTPLGSRSASAGYAGSVVGTPARPAPRAAPGPRHVRIDCDNHPHRTLQSAPRPEKEWLPDLEERAPDRERAETPAKDHTVDEITDRPSPEAEAGHIGVPRTRPKSTEKLRRWIPHQTSGGRDSPIRRRSARSGCRNRSETTGRDLLTQPRALRQIDGRR